MGFTPLHAACEARAVGALLALGVRVDAPRGTHSPLTLCLERADQRSSQLLLAAAADAKARARLLGLSTADAAHSALALANAASAEHPAAADELVRFLLDEEAAAAAAWAQGGHR